MNPAKLDPDLNILFLMSQDELRALESEQRLDMKVIDDVIYLTVSINCQGDLPELEGVQLIDRQGEICTVKTALDSLSELSDSENVTYISAIHGGYSLMYRTRREIGAAITDGKRIRNSTARWDGTGTVVGVIDSGFDLHHPAFRQYPGGPTRVEIYWDRVAAPRPGDTPGPGAIGVIYTRAQIDAHLLGAAATSSVVQEQSEDMGGHGTHVAGIATGSTSTNKGIAPGANIIFVRLRDQDISIVHDLCNWIFTQAGGPCAINISQGLSTGAHDGTSNVETGLDNLLRDPANLSARPGRFIAIAAGNDRQESFKVNTRILANGQAATQLIWVSPFGNNNTDEFEFWYSGLGQVAIRLISPLPAGNRITHWVDPHAAGSVERASPGGFAPTVAGPSPAKRFDFTGGTSAFISHAENPFNGDRQIVVRIQPTAGNNIPDGNWIIEFEGINALPGGGKIHGAIRKIAANAAANTVFRPIRETSQTIVVKPGTESQLDLFVQGITVGTPPAELSVFIEYPENQDLEVRLEPCRNNASPTSEWVAHGPNITVTAGATVHGAVTPDGFPFSFPSTGDGIDQPTLIDHQTNGNKKRIRIQLLQRPDPPGPNREPEQGIFKIHLRSVNTDRPVTADVRLHQDRLDMIDYCLFLDNRHNRVAADVYPDAAIPSVICLNIDNNLTFDTSFQVTVPGGNQARIRLKIPPEHDWQESGGWSFTPWISGGNIETAAAGALPVSGAPAAGAARQYVNGDIRVSFDYPAPAPGNDGIASIRLENTAFNELNQGEWKIEFQGIGITAPVRVISELNRRQETARDLERLLTPGFYNLSRYLPNIAYGSVFIPFSIPRNTADEIRLEILYDANNEIEIRLHPPEPYHLPYRVALNNAFTADAGAINPVVGASGVTGSLPVGTVVSCDMPNAAIFTGHRHAMMTIRRPAANAIFHPTGLWRVEIIPRQVGGDKKIVARLIATGHSANFLVTDSQDIEDGKSTLTNPSTAREVMTVANSLSGLGPLNFPNPSTSVGPLRKATRMRINGNSRRWLNYAKPEITSPGSDILAPCSGFASLWGNADVPLGWGAFSISDRRIRSMRATWPQLSNSERTHTQNVVPAAAAGTLTQTNWSFTLPQGASDPISFIIRYPAGRNFAVRVQQPAGGAAPLRTHAVRPNGTEWIVPGAGVAAGNNAPDHPDGSGRLYEMGDQTLIFIRQDGAGQATLFLRPLGNFANGDWQITVQHDEVFPAAVAVTLESQPPTDSLGWPKFNATLPPRVTGNLASAPTAANPAILDIPLTIPPRMIGDVAIQLRYAAAPPGPGAHVFGILVFNAGAAQHTSGIDTNSGTVAVPGSVASVAVLNGRRYTFAGGNRVTIVHTPGSATITLQRGGAANSRIADGEWRIRMFNSNTATPAAPVEITVDLDPGPHDAPLFLLPNGGLPYAFRRSENLVAATIQEWDFRMPEGRHEELQLELIYDARDTVELQLNVSGGGRTAPVRVGNVAVAGVAGATLADVAAGAAVSREFVDANRFRIFVDHRVHPETALRNRVLITIRPEGDNPIPAGNWQLRINPTAIHAASQGKAEGFMVEMYFQRLSGTSMASPHIAGLAALMLQQDTTQTHADIKRRMLQTTKNYVITRGNNTQLPNQWDPVAGWGSVNGTAALLGHEGGLLHQQGHPPAAKGKTTGCPVACEDNCLIEGVFNGANLTGLTSSPRAPYNYSPSAPGNESMPSCPRLHDYLNRYHQNPFTGGASASFRTVASAAIQQPLVRDRAQRGTLANFNSSSWDDIYTTLADRFVEQWSSTGTVIILEDKPESGLVREVLFNRFVHHLHRLLSASNQVTKCSFTTKRKVDVLGSRVPYGSPFNGAGFKALKELLNNNESQLVGRCDLSMAENIVVWGANLPANAQALWRNISAARAARGDALQVFVIDPGLQQVPDFARRICLHPGSDRHLALALMLKIVGNTGHATAIRQIPEDSRFTDGNRGIHVHLTNEISNLTDFVTHVQNVAAEYLSIPAPGDPVQMDAGLTDLILSNGTADEIRRMQYDFDALYDAYMSGQTTTLLGGSLGRYVDGEENIQYIAALAVLSGNMGKPGAGISLGEDLHLQFNDSSFASNHDSLRPELNTAELGEVSNQETLNLASLKADAPSNTKVFIWFGLDPLTHFPDSDNIQTLLGTGGSQLNIQVTSALDDSSRYADIILPIADTLQSWDLQMNKRSHWINLTQAIKPLHNEQARPIARVLHEIFKAIRSKLMDEFHDDLAPVIDEPSYDTGPLLLASSRRQWFTEFFTNSSRIPDLLVDRVPRDEAANIHVQLRDWYSSVHNGEPATDSVDSVTSNDWLKFFDRMQVDWILEILFARYSEREVVLILYNLLVSGTVLDPKRFGNDKLNILPDGCTPWSNHVANGSVFADLKGSSGFPAENASYRDAVLALDNGATGRNSFPMRLLLGQSVTFASTSIPLDEQRQAGAIRKPDVYVNQHSNSISTLGLSNGDTVTLVGNVAYTAGQTYSRVITEATIHFDPGMAKETLWMGYGWNGFNRGGQRLMRGIHSEEGENPALFDNLVKVQVAGSAAPASASERGNAPAKR